MASDGSTVSFTPTTSYSGPASFSIVADDGYGTSQVATVTMNVSDAPLVTLDLVVRPTQWGLQNGVTAKWDQVL